MLNPRDSGTLNNIGLALKENGHSEEAMDFFKKAVSIDSSNNQSYVNIGTTLMEGGRLQDAIVAFKESLKHSSGNAKLTICWELLYKTWQVRRSVDPKEIINIRP